LAWCDAFKNQLLQDIDLSNLVGKATASHTRLTYHRTWETGLGAAIRVTATSPDFFSSRHFFEDHSTLLLLNNLKHNSAVEVHLVRGAGVNVIGGINQQVADWGDEAWSGIFGRDFPSPGVGS
jgi:hypothetical protein